MMPQKIDSWGKGTYSITYTRVHRLNKQSNSKEISYTERRIYE